VQDQPGESSKPFTIAEPDGKLAVNTHFPMAFSAPGASADTSESASRGGSYVFPIIEPRSCSRGVGETTVSVSWWQQRRLYHFRPREATANDASFEPGASMRTRRDGTDVQEHRASALPRGVLAFSGSRDLKTKQSLHHSGSLGCLATATRFSWPRRLGRTASGLPREPSRSLPPPCSWPGHSSHQ
jgi:hypothetical protein